MPINIQKLKNIYDTGVSSENWIAVPDSKADTLIANAAGSSGGNPGNGWKIHISIDPKKMSQAAYLIAQILNNYAAPRVSLKFAGEKLAMTGQPSKQVAFIIYEEELKNKAKIAAFLNSVEYLLGSNNIGRDPRVINSDIEAAKTKFDAVIVDDQGKPTRFNYRNEQYIVMEDNLYCDLGGSNNITVRDKQIWVKQSYYLHLPDSQKHNPGHYIENPFTAIQIKSLQLKNSDPIIHPDSSSLSSEQIIEIKNLITKLQKEIQSSWPFPNKNRKIQKLEGLKVLLIKSISMDARTAVKEVEKEFPEIRKGNISTRTADLLDSLRNDKKNLQIKF